MLEPLTRSAVTALVGMSEGPVISCYLPTHRHDVAPKRDMAHLEQLIEPVPRLLEDMGFSADMGGVLLEPFRDLLANPELWRMRDRGLALFSAADLWRILSYHSPLPARLEVGFRPLVAPLIAVLPAAERFYILAISLNAVRVLEVAPGGVTRREIPGLPRDMSEALGYEQFESSLQVHSASPRGLGRHEPVYHGHGDADEERLKTDIESYFRRLAQALDAALDPELPRVLAMVETQVPIYLRASGDPHLVEEVVVGNPEASSDAELAERAVEILARRAEKRGEEEYRKLRERAPETTASGVDEVVTAACQGRVHALYVAPEAKSWGTYEPDLCRVEVHGERLPGDEDLIDLAVSRTLAQGGEAHPLYAVSERNKPPVAAVLRY